MHLDARWLNQLLQETAHKDAYQDIPQFKPVLYKQPKMYQALVVLTVNYLILHCLIGKKNKP
jgi:hypothetical protein